MSEENILTALAFRIFQVAPTALVYFCEEHVANLCIISEVVLTDNPSQSDRGHSGYEQFAPWLERGVLFKRVARIYTRIPKGLQ
jgi:hypothetical protein